jgi:hypothetical protein
MTEKTMLNFRCPADLLEAIDAIGQERYPSDTAKHGCDRTKTLLDIVRAGIEALSKGETVLQVVDINEETVLQVVDINEETVLQVADANQKTVLQTSADNVRQSKTSNAIDIEARFAAIEERLGKLRA